MFYRLYRDPDARRKGLHLAVIGEQPEIDLAWRLGCSFENPPSVPIRCLLGDRSGPDLPDAFLSDRIPLFSDRLIQCLQIAGITNFDCYKAEVFDNKGEAVSRVFFGVNIIGLISCVDMVNSEIHPLSEYPMLEFRKLSIDEEATRGAKLFRLTENPSFIITTDEVKNIIDKANLINVCALSLDNRAAY